MKINQSTVAMSSERQAMQAYVSQTKVTAAGVIGRGTQAEEQEAGATLELSEQSRSLQFNAESRFSVSGEGQYGSEIREPEEDFKIKMLRRLMESLRAMQEGRRPDYSKLERLEQKKISMQFNAVQTSFSAIGQTVSVAGAGGSVVSVGAGGWKEQVTMSTVFTDREVTRFSTMGSVRTADGRTIDFGLNLEMSREFTQATSMEYTRKVFCVDPLVINLEGSPASFTDQTFFFDLDGDGKEEKLSQLSSGSGLLALDKNGDGIINDGSELFGTKSGDGFKDLAAYDEDGNGWIDENDSVFRHLKIWTKDEHGNDRLISASEAGVGAIYLGKAGTEFSLNKQENNQKQGIIRSTGIYLKENGEAGTLQHVDFVV